MDTIKRLLDSLMQNNPLLTWQMYQERTGSVMIKMRFGNTELKEDSNNNGYFKRKSSNQIKRDNRRAEQHQQQIITKSKARTVSLMYMTARIVLWMFKMARTVSWMYMTARTVLWRFKLARTVS